MHLSRALLFVCAAASVHSLSYPEVSLPDFAAVKRSISGFLGARSGSIMKRASGSSGTTTTKTSTTTAAISAATSGSASCPPIWTKVSADLTAMFLTGGQCNDDARAAIRAAFHDCGTWNKAQGATGGCDGSLILAGETSRAENNGLQDISTKLLNLARLRGVGVADMLQFAGAHAVVTCPQGPRITTYVGRNDSSKPAPDGFLPDVHASGDSLFALFQDKGFDAVDLAALLGAHTTSKQFFVDTTQAGKPQDSTPGIWDVNYYAETYNPPAGNFRFDSDINLANQAVVGPEFKGFVNNQGKWNGKFADAMTRMSLLGVPGGSTKLIDCTNALPAGTKKRDIKAAPINDRIR